MKNQTKCYRTINGQKWDLKDNSEIDTNRIINDLKQQGKTFKIIKYKGINRIFIKP